MSKGQINHESNSNFFARLFLANLNPLSRLGSTRQLQLEDIGLIVEEERVEKVHEKFLVAWAKQMALPKEK